jgi:hypothetical protein
MKSFIYLQKNAMRILGITIGLLMLHTSIQAQKALAGFYITLRGDTVTGSFPQFKQWKNNPSAVRFETAVKQVIELTPGMCRSFTIPGYDTYETMETNRMTNSTRFSEYKFRMLNRQSDTATYERINAFFRRVFFSKSLSLYEFSDTKRMNYFLKTVDGVSELIYRVYYAGNTMIKDETYKAQLSALFTTNIEANAKLKRKIDQLDYDEDAIVSFLETVYNMDSAKGKTDSRPTDFFIAGGVSYNTFKVNSSGQLVLPPATIKYNSSVVPVLIVGAIHYIRRNFNRYFITTEIKYTSFDHRGKTSADREWRYKSQIIAPGIGVGVKWINKETFGWYTTIITSGMIMVGNKETGYNGSVTERNGRSFIIGIGLQTGMLFRNFVVWGQFNPHITTYAANNYSPTLNFNFTGISWRMPLKKK